MLLSIVTTLYKGEHTIQRFLSSFSQVANDLVGQEFEFILVNDGSPTNDVGVVLSLFEEYQNVTLVDLSRNFGQHAALFEGLKYAGGEFVYVCDSDLDEPADWLKDFWTTLHSGKFDIVLATSENQNRSVLSNLLSKLAWSITNAQSSQFKRGVFVTARLMKSHVKDAVLQFREKNLFMAHIFSYVGFNATTISVKKIHSDGSSYTIFKRLNLLFAGIQSNYNIAITLVTLSLLAYIIISVIVAAYALYSYIQFGPISGWVSLMVFSSVSTTIILLALTALLFFITGIIDEVKERPRTITKQVIHSKESQISDEKTL